MAAPSTSRPTCTWRASPPRPGASASDLSRSAQPSGSAAGLGDLFLEDALHAGRIELALVGLHDLAHQAAGLLEVEAGAGQDLLHRHPHLVVAGQLGQEAAAKGDLEVELRQRFGALFTERGVLIPRLAQ